MADSRKLKCTVACDKFLEQLTVVENPTYAVILYYHYHSS